MSLDIELYRRTIYTPIDRQAQRLRRISVIDIHPRDATRTLVLVHGYGGSATQWLYQLQYFGQTMRVIAPDMRGHGMSDDPENLPYTMQGLIDDLKLVLDRLEVQRPFHLLAHSFGGAISTEYALRHPEEVSGLVLIGVPTRFILRAVVERLMLIPDPLFSWIAKVIKVALFAPQRTLKRMLHSVLSPWRGDERVQLLRVPTLVVLGHRDTVFLREHYEDMSRNIPHSQQVVIPVSAHLVQLERPDAVNRAIRRFIEPKDSIKSEPRTRATQLSPHASRHAEMPWLQYYDREVPESLPLPKQLLHDLLSNAAREFPDRAALIFFGQKIGYHELDRLSNRFAHALRKRPDRNWCRRSALPWRRRHSRESARSPSRRNSPSPASPCRARCARASPARPARVRVVDEARHPPWRAARSGRAALAGVGIGERIVARRRLDAARQHGRFGQ